MCDEVRLTTFVVAGIDILLVHSGDRWLALEKPFNVLVIVELVIAGRRLRGGLAVVVLVMGRDLTEHHAVVFLQQGIA